MMNRKNSSKKTFAPLSRVRDFIRILRGDNFKVPEDAPLLLCVLDLVRLCRILKNSGRLRNLNIAFVAGLLMVSSVVVGNLFLTQKVNAQWGEIAWRCKDGKVPFNNNQELQIGALLYPHSARLETFRGRTYSDEVAITLVPYLATGGSTPLYYFLVPESTGNSFHLYCSNSPLTAYREFPTELYFTMLLQPEDRSRQKDLQTFLNNITAFEALKLFSIGAELRIPFETLQGIADLPKFFQTLFEPKRVDFLEDWWHGEISLRPGRRHGDSHPPFEAFSYRPPRAGDVSSWAFTLVLPEPFEAIEEDLSEKIFLLDGNSSYNFVDVTHNDQQKYQITWSPNFMPAHLRLEGFEDIPIPEKFLNGEEERWELTVDEMIALVQVRNAVHDGHLRFFDRDGHQIPQDQSYVAPVALGRLSTPLVVDRIEPAALKDDCAVPLNVSLQDVLQPKVFDLESSCHKVTLYEIQRHGQTPEQVRGCLNNPDTPAGKLEISCIHLQDSPVILIWPDRALLELSPERLGSATFHVSAGEAVIPPRRTEIQLPDLFRTLHDLSGQMSLLGCGPVQRDRENIYTAMCNTDEAPIRLSIAGFYGGHRQQTIPLETVVDEEESLHLRVPEGTELFAVFKVRLPEGDFRYPESWGIDPTAENGPQTRLPTIISMPLSELEREKVFPGVNEASHCEIRVTFVLADAINGREVTLNRVCSAIVPIDVEVYLPEAFGDVEEDLSDVMELEGLEGFERPNPDARKSYTAKTRASGRIGGTLNIQGIAIPVKTPRLEGRTYVIEKDPDRKFAIDYTFRLHANDEIEYELEGAENIFLSAETPLDQIMVDELPFQYSFRAQGSEALRDACSLLDGSLTVAQLLSDDREIVLESSCKVNTIQWPDELEGEPQVRGCVTHEINGNLLTCWRKKGEALSLTWPGTPTQSKGFSAEVLDAPERNRENSLSFALTEMDRDPISMKINLSQIFEQEDLDLSIELNQESACGAFTPGEDENRHIYSVSCSEIPETIKIGGFNEIQTAEHIDGTTITLARGDLTARFKVTFEALGRNYAKQGGDYSLSGTIEEFEVPLNTLTQEFRIDGIDVCDISHTFTVQDAITGTEVSLNSPCTLREISWDQGISIETDGCLNEPSFDVEARRTPCLYRDGHAFDFRRTGDGYEPYSVNWQNERTSFNLSSDDFSVETYAIRVILPSEFGEHDIKLVERENSRIHILDTTNPEAAEPVQACPFSPSSDANAYTAECGDLPEKISLKISGFTPIPIKDGNTFTEPFELTGRHIKGLLNLEQMKANFVLELEDNLGIPYQGMSNEEASSHGRKQIALHELGAPLTFLTEHERHRACNIEQTLRWEDVQALIEDGRPVRLHSPCRASDVSFPQNLFRQELVRNTSCTESGDDITTEGFRCVYHHETTAITIDLVGGWEQISLSVEDNPDALAVTLAEFIAKWPFSQGEPWLEDPQNMGDACQSPPTYRVSSFSYENEEYTPEEPIMFHGGQMPTLEEHWDAEQGVPTRLTTTFQKTSLNQSYRETFQLSVNISDIPLQEHLEDISREQDGFRLRDEYPVTIESNAPQNLSTRVWLFDDFQSCDEGLFDSAGDQNHHAIFTLAGVSALTGHACSHALITTNQQAPLTACTPCELNQGDASQVRCHPVIATIPGRRFAVVVANSNDLLPWGVDIQEALIDWLKGFPQQNPVPLSFFVIGAENDSAIQPLFMGENLMDFPISQEIEKIWFIESNLNPLKNLRDVHNYFEEHGEEVTHVLYISNSKPWAVGNLARELQWISQWLNEDLSLTIVTDTESNCQDNWQMLNNDINNAECLALQNPGNTLPSILESFWEDVQESLADF